MSSSTLEALVGVVSAIGSMAAAVAAWWAARVALRVARDGTNAQSERDARVEAVAKCGTRIDDLLKMLAVAEQASLDGEPWVRGEGVHADARLRTPTAQPGSREAHAAAAAEFRARLLVTPEYLPLTRGLVLDGVPFDAGAAGTPFTDLDETLGDERGWWLGLQLNDHVPIGLQVVRAEILANVRGLEELERTVAASSAAVVTAFDGWGLDSRSGELTIKRTRRPAKEGRS